MATLALIVSGESPQHPKIAKALKLLAEVEFHGVYALSMRAHVWSYLPKSIYGKLMRADADRMIRSSYGKSRFGYYLVDPNESQARIKATRIDNSTTQYGVLALWQAAKSGVPIPDGFWIDAIESFLGQQAEDGGWAYSGNRNTSQTMTCAGLAVLMVSQQQLFRDQSTPNPKVAAAIEKGLGYLDKNFGADGGGHGGNGYLFYGYERVALASGRKFFGGKDWFQTLAKPIISVNANYGSSIHNAAFHLMFLARGRVPVWINKLEIPGAKWNNRPNDIYFLNRYISEYREHEVNWQVVNVDTSGPADWISAPLMWISSSDPIEFTPAQVAKIKNYIDMGGTLLVNAEGSSSFRASIENLAEQMYPDLKFTPLDRKHPIVNLLEGDPRGSRKPNIRVLSNGARELIIMPKDDWGMTFQKDKNPDPDKNDDWKYITNIYGLVTDRGSLTPRLSSPLIKPEARGTVGTVKVVIPTFEDPAGKMPETDVYRMMRVYMHNLTGMKLDVQQVPFSEIATASPALLHIVGVNPVKMTEGEVKAVDAFIKSGGTVLIENLGGKRGFAESVTQQLEGILPGEHDKVSERSDIITGRNLPEGSTKNRRLVFRRIVLENSNPDARLLLRGYTAGERTPVYLSFEDLSLGMLGVKQFGINGYSTNTARNLMVNILLEAQKFKAGG